MPKKQNKIKPRRHLLKLRTGILVPILLFALAGSYWLVVRGSGQEIVQNGNALIDYDPGRYCLGRTATAQAGIGVTGHADTLRNGSPWAVRWAVTGSYAHISPTSGSVTAPVQGGSYFSYAQFSFTPTDVRARVVLTLTVTSRTGVRSAVSQSLITSVIADCTGGGGGGDQGDPGDGGDGDGEGGEGDGEGDRGTGSGKEGTGNGNQGEGPAVKSNAQTPSPSPQPGPNPRPTNVATTQGDEPNPIPAQSPQGTSKDQLNLEPSPFYDGKQYEPGSDPDLLGVDTTFSVAGHNLKYGWAYLAGLIILTGTGGYYIWKKQPKFLKKLKLK